MNSLNTYQEQERSMMDTLKIQFIGKLESVGLSETELIMVVSKWLDETLEFGLDYEISFIKDHDDPTIIIVVDTEESGAWGEAWERKLERLVMLIALRLNAWYSWKGKRIGLHLTNKRKATQ